MSFFQNTCKPKGFAGKIMVNMMNTGHAALAEWGLTHIKIRDDDFCLDIGCGGGANLKRLLGKSSNGHITGVDYSEVSRKNLIGQQFRKADAKFCKAML